MNDSNGEFQAERAGEELRLWECSDMLSCALCASKIAVLSALFVDDSSMVASNCATSSAAALRSAAALACPAHPLPWPGAELRALEVDIAVDKRARALGAWRQLERWQKQPRLRRVVHRHPVGVQKKCATGRTQNSRATAVF